MRQNITDAEHAERLKNIRRLLPLAWRSHAAATDFAYSPAASGDGGPSGDIAFSDPSGEVAISRSAARGRVQRHRRLFAEIESKMMEAISDTENVYFGKPGTRGYEETVVMTHSKDSMLTGAEKTDTEAAYRRRLARGDL